jgi:PIN domain nuclease of toxin-antitoxin system
MYLLDTNIILYFLTGDAKLAPDVSSFIDTHQDSIVISVVSAWEISIKKNLGKLNLDQDPIMYLVDQGIECLSLELADIKALDTFGDHHKDPFDRILLSQAYHRELTIITSDKIFLQYTTHVMLV